MKLEKILLCVTAMLWYKSQPLRNKTHTFPYSKYVYRVKLPFLLHLAGVDDIYDVVNSYRGLSDVCGDDNLCDAFLGPVENCLLLLIGQGGVEWIHLTPNKWKGQPY